MHMAYKLLFLDTETTGNEEKDYLCQIAYSIDGMRKSALFKPQVPISVDSMAVHHITNKMVADKPAFKFSFEYDELHKLLQDDDVILVAHNAVFDIRMLEKEGLKVPKFICTLRVARFLDAEEKINSYRLQYLRYLLEIEVDAEAHDAMGDVLVLEQLFGRLLKKIMEEGRASVDDARHDFAKSEKEKAIEKMLEISSHPSLIKSFKFGKHNGKKIHEVLEVDRNYLEWLLTQKLENNADDEDWIYTLKVSLGKLI